MKASGSPPTRGGGIAPIESRRSTRGTAWLKVALAVLVCEKIVQHVVVTLAFYFRWSDLSRTVAVEPRVLMVLGGIAAGLFAVTLWGLLSRRSWAPGLAIGLAMFDIVGEFVAQGTLAIDITVSIVVAVLLLILALRYRRQRV